MFSSVIGLRVSPVPSKDWPWHQGQSLSRVWLCGTLWTAALQAPLSMGFLGKNTGGACHFLLQGIFPIQRLNPGLLHCRQILHELSHQGSTRILEWVAYSFCRGSSQARNWTGVSCIAHGCCFFFFLLTSWATRKPKVTIPYPKTSLLNLMACWAVSSRNLMILWKCCTQYARKFGKLSSGHRTGNGQFSFQSLR